MASNADMPILCISSVHTHSLLSQQTSVTKQGLRDVIVKNVKMVKTRHIPMKPIQAVVLAEVKTCYIFRILVM